MSDEKKLWGGRFRGKADPRFAAFNQSFTFDQRLFSVDVEASQAYCNALLNAGVLSAIEAEQIQTALTTILQNGRDESYFHDDAEDVHSFVETRLIELIGDVGRKLHTGRSRNDQVATDTRLWLREAIDNLQQRTRDVQLALLDFAETNQEVVLPGYTHLQRAQPVLLAHWCLAYFEMLNRDRERLAGARRRTNVMPLGAGALAGNALAIDREALARQLGFESVSLNSLDAVSDRDFCVDFVSAGALVMVHLSRLAEDIILYTTREFGLFELGDAVATGSSLMPQKKNPDSLELIRGKTGRVCGSLQALLVMLKGLPLAYNKDMQEDKEAVFDTFDSVSGCLEVTETVLRNLLVNSSLSRNAATTGFLNATELADYLVRKGVPFRTAHETVGQIVLRAIERGVELEQLELSELRTFSTLIDEDVYQTLSLEQTLASKNVTGGTAPERVKEALAVARARLG